MSKSSDRVKAWRKATKERMVAAMGGKCQCCGYDKCMESLDFHHKDPQSKEISLGSIRANPRAWPIIVNELRKCILVCRNCHGELHYGSRPLPDIHASFNEEFAEFKLQPELCDICPKCGKPKLKHHMFCSRRCAGMVREYDWGLYDLVEMAKTKTAAQIAEEIGCCKGTAVRKLRELGVKPLKPACHATRSYVPFVYVKESKEQKPKASEIDPNWRRRPRTEQRKVLRPSAEELQKLVWEKSIAAIGKDYGVRDNTIRKWCKSVGVTWPPEGYWQRRQAGHSHEDSLVSQRKPLKGKRFITEQIAKEAHQIRQSEGLSYRAAAERVGFKGWGLKQAFKRYGLE